MGARQTQRGTARPGGVDLELSRAAAWWWALFGTTPVERANNAIAVGLPLVVAVGTAQLSTGVTPLGFWVLVACGLVQSAAMCGYRRLPLAAMLVVSAAELTAVLTTGKSLALGVLLAASGLAAWAPWRQRVLGATAGVGLLMVEYLVLGDPKDNWVGLATTLIGFLALWTAGRFEAHQRTRIAELDARSALLEGTVSRERALLARELHDILNHSVTAMLLDAEAGAQTGDEAAARATLWRVADTGRSSLAELRRLLGVLRADPAEGGGAAGAAPLTPPPALSQVDELVAAVPDGGPRVRLERHGTVRLLDTSIEHAGYRVVQEALTNVAKHAGPVPVTVRLRYLSDVLEIEVRNAAGRVAEHNGHHAGAGTGLLGMRERVSLLGGTLHAGRDADGGFTVAASLPVREPV
ncbi:MAG TPA: histidine kinase [Pseudonocardiaceae bacterium]|nr:histidine kinase [Pseudonocardiaceae bacterium]